MNGAQKKIANYLRNLNNITFINKNFKFFLLVTSVSILKKLKKYENRKSIDFY